MQKRSLLYLGLLTLQTGILCQYSTAQYMGANRVKDCGSGIQVTENEVLSGLLPATPNVPSACSSAGRQAIQKFVEEDRNNWEVLSNRACSAKLGWVENSPGICSAGGPPPICLRKDHWHIDRDRAESAWKRYQGGIRASREKTASDAACGCWLDLSKGSVSRLSNSYLPQPSNYNGYSGDAIIPCSTSDQCQAIEPGSICSSRNVCEIPGLVERSVRSAAALAGAKANDHALDKAADVMAEAALAALPKKVAVLLAEMGEYFAPPLAALATGMAPTNDRYLVESYQSTIEQIHDELSELQRMVAQAKQMDAKKGPYVPYSRADLSDQIKKLKTQISSNMGLANNLVEGIAQERQLPPGGCYNVLQYQNSAINAEVGQIYSLSN